MNLGIERDRTGCLVIPSQQAIWLITLSLLLLPAASSGSASGISPQVLVDAELAFAKRTAEAGIREGFLAFLANDSVVFRPGPVNGREAYSKVKPSPALLAWCPVFADISAAGDLGYTTGPFELFRNKDEKTALASGHYVSIWRKQEDRNYKVVLDTGVGHGAHPTRQPVYIAPAGAGAATDQSHGGGDAERELTAHEQRQSDAAAVGGQASALETRLDEAARVYRDTEYPAVGRTKALDLVGKVSGHLTWTPARVRVAGSGDLGYAYGLAEREEGSPKRFAFLRIWRRTGTGPWLVVLDLLTAVPD
jgi:ketosteroid isomerase-like protein